MMNTIILSGLWVLLSASQGVLAQGSPSQSVVSKPKSISPIEGYTPGEYRRGNGEDEAHEAYKEKLLLKQKPIQAYGHADEESLTDQEKELYTEMETAKKDEEAIQKTVNDISATMDSVYTKALSWVTWGYVQGNSHPDAGTYSQADLDKAKNDLLTLQKAIKAQEDGLEEISGSLNEMTEEKEKLKTTTPGFFKKGDQPAIFQEKLGQLTAKDTLKEKLQKAKKKTNASAIDSSAVAILAERFILKLAALDELYDMLTEKIEKFSARIAEDKEILKLMQEDPEFKQGGVTWWDKLKARLIVEGNTSTGLTPEQNKRLRAGLAQIKKVLEDEVAQYAKVLATFKDYATSLPNNINNFRIKKVNFFTTHYKAVKDDLTKLYMKAVDDFTNASEVFLNNMKEMKNTSTGHPSDNEQIKPPKNLLDLRNKTGSLKRQLYFLEQATNVKPLTEEELQTLNKKIRESITETADPKKLKKEGSLDDMLEALVTLTQIANESGEDILNPLLNAKLKGFFGASLIKDIAKKSAPAAIKTLTGIAQSKLAQIAAAGGVTPNSPQLEILKIINEINKIDENLAEKKDSGSNKTLEGQKQTLQEELEAFMSLVNCENPLIDPEKRQQSCSDALKAIEKKTEQKQQSEKNQTLIAEKAKLQATLAELKKATQSTRQHKSSATNDIQRQQESLGLVMDALVDVIQNSNQIRVEAALARIEPLLPEFQASFLESAKKKVLGWVVPYISGLAEAQLSSAIKAHNPDPTKRKYYDSGITDLLIARITAKKGTPEYNALSAKIKTAYEDIMKVRQKYKDSLMTLGAQPTQRYLWGWGSETETSKRQKKLLTKESKKAASALNEEKKKYETGIQQQANH